MQGVDLSGRPKNLYGVMRKMSEKQKGLDQVYDVRALRVVVKSKTDCYAVLNQVWHRTRPPYQALFPWNPTLHLICNRLLSTFPYLQISYSQVRQGLHLSSSCRGHLITKKQYPCTIFVLRGDCTVARMRLLKALLVPNKEM